jgi:hypothetical protein
MAYIKAIVNAGLATGHVRFSNKPLFAGFSPA